MFHCLVMGANAKRGSRTQNEIVASKRELPVKNIKHPYSYLTPMECRLCQNPKNLKGYD